MNEIPSQVSDQVIEARIEGTPNMDLETARKILQSVVDFDDSKLTEDHLDRIEGYTAQEIGRAAPVVCENLMDKEQAGWGYFSELYKDRILTKRVGEGNLRIGLNYKLSEENIWIPESIELHYRSYGSDEDLIEAYNDLEDISMEKFVEAIENGADPFDEIDSGESMLDHLPQKSQKVFQEFRETEAEYYLDPDGITSSFSNFRDEKADGEVIYEDMGMTTGLKEEFDLEKYKTIFRGSRWIFANLLNWDRDYISPEDLPGWENQKQS